MTVAPHSTANWIAAWPTAPEPAVHEKRVGRADGERAQRLVGGADRDAERGALGGADLRRSRLRVLGADHDLGRVRARRAEDDHGVADAEAVDFVADGGHDAGAVAADPARLGDRPGRALAAAQLPVDRVHTGRFDADRDLARARAPGSGCR